jgi:peroxiredoxin Q/BCP
MFKLHNGEAAPEIALQDVQGKDWKLSDYKGKMVALYFARGEYCPTTRGEFALWNSYFRNFAKMNCHMAFVVNGGLEEHRNFHDALRMRAPILHDPDGSVGEMYGIYGVNHNDKKRDDYKNYIAPSVYLIDADGEIACFWIASAPRGMPTPDAILGILAYASNNGWKY